MQITDDADRDASPMGTGAVFPKEDALPGTEIATTAFNGNGQRCERQDGADMGGHIIGTFAVVNERGIAIGHQRAANCSRSRRTVGSAFSQTMSDALVWCTKT